MSACAWMRGWLLALLLAPGLLLAGQARAGDACPALAQRQADLVVAVRVAAVACAEHLRWNRPFIDEHGRLASLVAYEAESNGLQDGSAPWRRVAFYWQSSGLLAAMAFRAGASDCGYAALSLSYPGLGCRAFVVDNPWSAAFISWVMQRAGVPAFRSSASHFDYVRAARLDPAGSPYRFVAPESAPIEQGDLLCYVRAGLVHGTEGLARLLDGRGGGLPMHCDVIVATEAGRAYAVGGNVQQAVTMRLLDLNAQGHLWGLPRRLAGDTACSPDAADACNFNRQDWAVLLKLKPQEELARLGPVEPPAALPNPPVAPETPTCCVQCVLGADVPRCPVSGPPPATPPETVPLQGAG